MMSPSEVNSSWHDCDPGDYRFSEVEAVSAGVLASMIAGFGAALNLCTVLALLNYQRTRVHITTPFVVSLAASDFVFSTVTLPILASKFFAGDWLLGEVGCKMYPIFFYGNSAVTLFSLMSVTINRWAQIQNQDKCDRVFTRRNSKLIIAVCWILPLLLLLPSTLGVFGRHGIDCHSRSCTILGDEHGHNPKITFLMCGLTIPCVVLAATNLLIYYKVKTLSMQLTSAMRDSAMRKNHGLREREQRLTRMLLFVFGCFLVTYMPGVIVKVTDKDIEYPTLHVVTYVINWFAVILNPVIYVVTQERYRQALRYLFRGGGGRGSGPGGDVINGRGSMALSKVQNRSTVRAGDYRSSASAENHHVHYNNK